MAYQQPQQNRWDHVEPSEGDHAPPPPAHRQPVALQQLPNNRQYSDPNNYSDYSTPGVTPGSDHLSENAAGGINGIGVAHAHDGDSGVRPLGVPERSPNATPFGDQHAYDQPMPPRAMYSQRSYGSGAMYSSNSSMHSIPPPPQGLPYSDSPYNRYSSTTLNLASGMSHINPNEVADDDDWGMGPNSAQHKRRSFLPLGGSRDGSRNGSPGSSINAGVAGVGTAGAAGGAYAATRDGSGKYNAVPTINGSNASNSEILPEKTNWRVQDDLKKRKRRMWIVIAIITIVLLGAILGGVLGAMLNRSGSHDAKSSTGQSANDVAADNKNDLSKDSSEIKALMNNANLHKVFPGMDYTPLNAQYPDCLHVGPSQNNITRDMAVMSQLTNAVRTYGTDCNQTQMLIHAIDRLEIKDTMKIWLGVWLDNNDTTTTRQIDQTWKVLDDYGCDYFKGVIIGNEVLYRKDLTATQLLSHVTDFRQNLTNHKCQLPVAMADLGDNWTADMASKVDVVMSNVHPFFAGVDVSTAADWTWDFWSTHDKALTANNQKIKQVIAEVGWPSGGGKDCGGAATCTSTTPGSVAGIDEMNKFLDSWVCQSMKNGTEYFWFSAFDEPWKIQYNKGDQNWEDKWGLMDINRNLKPGVKIPDCAGQTLPSF